MAETPWWVTQPVDTTPTEINWTELLLKMKQQLEEEAKNPPPPPVHIVSLRQYRWMVANGIIKPQSEDPSRGKQQGEHSE